MVVVAQSVLHDAIPDTSAFCKVVITAHGNPKVRPGEAMGVDNTSGHQHGCLLRRSAWGLWGTVAGRSQTKWK